MEKGGLGNALDAVGLTGASRIGFGDEMRLGLRGTTRRVWGRRGTKVRQRLQLTYEWRYLFAAVDGQTGRVWWNWVPSMKAEALWPTIAGIQEMGILDGLVWDNAPSHRDGDIADLDLAFVGLPPYSPELNPAERLFEEIRRHVEGRVYATLDDKVAEVQDFLEKLDADPTRVRRLCGWDWINAAIASLPAPPGKCGVAMRDRYNARLRGGATLPEGAELLERRALRPLRRIGRPGIPSAFVCATKPTAQGSCCAPDLLLQLARGTRNSGPLTRFW